MRARAGWLLLAAMLISGCGRAPEFNILGSYFPGWIACVIAGIALAAGVRVLLRWVRLERSLRGLPVLYLALATLFASLLWLVIF